MSLNLLEGQRIISEKCWKFKSIWSCWTIQSILFLVPYHALQFFSLLDPEDPLLQTLCLVPNPYICLENIHQSVQILEKTPPTRKATQSKFYCRIRLHLEFSAKLRIWQVPACKMEPRSGNIFCKNRPTRPTDRPASLVYGLAFAFNVVRCPHPNCFPHQ